MLLKLLRNHLFITYFIYYANLSEKLTFLKPWYAHARYCFHYKYRLRVVQTEAHNFCFQHLSLTSLIITFSVLLLFSKIWHFTRLKFVWLFLDQLDNLKANNCSTDYYNRYILYKGIWSIISILQTHN